jgi:hypothetical protein
MADAHDVPAVLRPGPHEHGLASGDLGALADSIGQGWELFGKVASTADLDAPSRREGWLGRDIVARVGHWPFTRGLDDLLGDAQSGEAAAHDSESTDRVILERSPDLSEAEIRASIDAAATRTLDWLSGDGPQVWGLVPTSSPLGPLPLLTVVHAMNFQLAVAALDLEPCHADVRDELLDLGVLALLDTVGGLAARAEVTGTFTARTGTTTLGIGSRNGRWRTQELSSHEWLGPGVETDNRSLINATSGRVSATALYRSGEVRVHDLAGMVRLAPALDGVPGIPPMGAVGRALHVMDAVGGLLGRFRR